MKSRVMAIAFCLATSGYCPAAATNDEITLPAVSATIDAGGCKAKYEPGDNRRCVGFWDTTNVVVKWRCDIPARGAYRILLVYAAQVSEPGPTLEVIAGDQRADGIAKPTGDWGRFTELDLGPVVFRKPGTIDIFVRAIRLCSNHGVNLRAMRLVREP